MARPKDIRLPLQPLLDITGESPESLRIRLGLGSGQVYFWSKNHLTLKRADQLAIACGWHPVLIWGDDWLQGIEEAQPCGHPWERQVHRWGKLRCLECESLRPSRGKRQQRQQSLFAEEMAS